MRAVIAVLTGLALLLAAAPAALADAGLAKTYADSYQAAKPVPLASSQVKGLDLKKAYIIQQAYVAELVKAGHKPAGLKGGLTSKPAQDKFKAPGPVTGVLMNTMIIEGGAVDSKPFTKMMLEVEIGYILGKDVTAPVTPETVKACVAEVMPAVEVPDLNFASMKGLTFHDIVAANVGARGYIVGKAQPLAQVDVNAVTGQLFMNGKPLGKAVPGRAALGDQYKALAWVINNAMENGMQVKSGMLVITGSLGPMFPGKPGAYKAVYTGGLGEIEFSVK